MKRVAAALVALAFAAPAATADAHDVPWYWSEGRAEDRVALRFVADIFDVNCIGYGKRIRLPKRVRGYRHFDCTLVWLDDSESHGVVHVLGKRRFRINFYDA